MEIKSNEQWKLDGDCSVCRRNNYCKSECGPSKKYTSRVTRQIIQEAFIKKSLEYLLKHQKESINE